ncbi:MAG: Ku protein [Thermoleophilaceae bacterium]|nr:Ku protein [Thermoleophilaceae bacterium]
MTVPVKVFGAVESKQVRFREVHLADGAPLEHRRLCSKEGEEVPYEEVVRGYELEPGRYVVLTSDEIQAVERIGSKTIEIEDFVPADQIDPVYYDKPYYLGPGKGGADAYRLLARALERTGRVGIGRFVLRTKERLVALHPSDGVLRIDTMRFHDEVVSGSEVEIPRPQTAVSEREAKMGETLVEALVHEWRPEDYADTYRERVLELVRAKAAGETIEPPPPAPGPAPDLLGALEASLAEARKRGGGKARPRAKRAAGRGRPPARAGSRR